MNLFDIIGPVMIGPSSSHTAGAARIGYVAAKLLNARPSTADIWLSGSFAATAEGHGTDKAILAGLLSMLPDDRRLPQSPSIAKEEGLIYHFYQEELPNAHPNTARIRLTDSEGNSLTIQAYSSGGGRIVVNRLDNIKVAFSADKPTLIIRYLDRPGVLSQAAGILSSAGLNIASLQSFREKRGGNVVIVAETDERISPEVIRQFLREKDLTQTVYIE